MKPLKPGLYRIWWASGGCSLAAVGVTRDGGRWLAPCNWLTPAVPFVEDDWSKILRADLLLSQARTEADLEEPPPDWVEHVRAAHAQLETVLDHFGGE